MKKVFCILMAALLLMTSVSSAFAISLFDKRWNQGEYIIELTDEEIARYSAIFETALKKSEGTPTREKFDSMSSHEIRYQLYAENGPVIKQKRFDDIGLAPNVLGLPDEQAITAEQALFIAYHALQECYQLTDEQLTTILPFWTYLLPDGSVPVWEISFESYDFTNEFTCFALVDIFAYDSSIWGINETEKSYG